MENLSLNPNLNLNLNQKTKRNSHEILQFLTNVKRKLSSYYRQITKQFPFQLFSNIEIKKYCNKIQKIKKTTTT